MAQKGEVRSDDYGCFYYRMKSTALSIVDHPKQSMKRVQPFHLDYNIFVNKLQMSKSTRENFRISRYTIRGKYNRANIFKHSIGRTQLFYFMSGLYSAFI